MAIAWDKTATTTKQKGKIRWDHPAAVSVAQEKPGLVKSVVQSVANIPTRLLSSVAPVVETIQGKSQAEIARRNVEGRDFGYFGQDKKPLGYQASQYQLGEKSLEKAAIDTLKDTAGLGLEAASFAVPVGKATTIGKTTLRGVIKEGARLGAVTGAKTGAASGAGSELQTEDSTLKSVLGNASVGGVIGGVTGGALGGAAAIPKGVQRQVRPTNTQAVEELTKAYDELFRSTKSGTNRLEKAISTGKDPRKFLAENGVLVDITPDRKVDTATARVFLKKKVNELDDVLSEGLKSSNKFVNLKDISDIVVANLDNAKTRGDASVALRQAQVKNIFKEYKKIYGDVVPLDVLNEIKRGQSNMSTVWDSTKPFFSKDVHYQISKAARETIEREAKDLPVANLNKFYGDHLNAISILGKIHGNAIEGGRVGKYFSQTAGAVVGSALGTPLGPAGNVTGAYVGSRVGDVLQKKSAINKITPAMVRRAVKSGRLKYGNKALEEFQRSAGLK